jgi:hypothetical protein
VISQDTVVEQLAALDPSLQAALRQHIADHERVLPYLFLGDAARWTIARYLAGDIEAARRLLALLESQYANGDEGARDLIALGFVENLPSTGAPAAELRKMLGPRLSEEYGRVNW